MLRFVVRRLASAVLLLYLVLTAAFFLVHLAPGDPSLIYIAEGRGQLTAADRQVMRERFGLDRPIAERYVQWLYTVTVRGDWGRSYDTGQPTTQRVAAALPNTLLLVAGTVVVQYGLGLLLGVLAALRRGLLDHLVRGVAMLLWALPAFVLALLSVEVFGVRLGWLPIDGMRSLDADQWSAAARLTDLLRHLVLPATILGVASCAMVVRMVRNNLLEVLEQDYVRAARARGLSSTRVLFGHALPNTVRPLIQDAGVVIPALLGGSVIIEQIFSWPGIGRLAFDAIGTRDYPIVLATTALSGALVVIGTTAADLLHAWLDPRVRETRG